MEKSIEKKVEKDEEKKEARMGLERFMRSCPQRRGVAVLLRLKYANDAKTKSEWNDAINALLKEKVEG